jgi:hypothetical protein
MLELLTAGAKMPSDDEPLFLFDAEMQEEGDEVMIDQITGNTLSRYLASYAGQAGYTNKIINHAEYGKVMSLAGNCYHWSSSWFKPPSVIPAGKKLVYQIEFQSPVTGTCFGTGGHFNGNTFRLGFSMTKSSSYGMILVSNPSSSSGGSTTVPGDSTMQDLRIEYLNATTIRARMEGKVGVGGPYTHNSNYFTSLWVFCNPREAAGLGTAKTLYGNIKRIKVSLEKI